MDRFLVLVFGSIIAFLILRYRRLIKEFTGDFDFAERIFGMGGTNTFIVLFGILSFILSLMYALGTLQALLSSSLGMFF